MLDGTAGGGAGLACVGRGWMGGASCMGEGIVANLPKPKVGTHL